MRSPPTAQSSPSMKKIFALLCAAGLIAFLSSCSTYKPGLLGLKAELLSIERDGQGGATASLQLVNPNVVSYIVSESRHKVYVNNRYIGTATIKQPAGVPTRANVPQSGPISLERNAGEVLDAAGGSASYRLDSDLTIQLYGEIFEKHASAASGTIRIVTK